MTFQNRTFNTSLDSSSQTKNKLLHQSKIQSAGNQPLWLTINLWNFEHSDLYPKNVPLIQNIKK